MDRSYRGYGQELPRPWAGATEAMGKSYEAMDTSYRGDMKLIVAEAMGRNYLGHGQEFPNHGQK